MKYLLYIFCFISALLHAQNYTEQEGYIPVEGGNIWYKIIGNPNTTPLIILHGGPGGRSCSSIPNYSLLVKDHLLVFYDQLGSGKSDNPQDTTLWNVRRFANELQTLRDSLHLDTVHIMGSSWGAAIVIEYMATNDPKGVASIIFSGPLISTAVWVTDAQVLLSQLSIPVQDTIKKYEKLERYENPAFLAATDTFYSHYMSVVPRKPFAMPDCAGSSRFNKAIYDYMWGPTEFTAKGTLTSFDRVEDLTQLTVPVLFLVGRNDEARPETMYKFQKVTPNSQVVIIENAGHAKIYDQPEETTQAIHFFIESL